MKQLLLKITIVCLTLLLVNCSDSNETLEDRLPPITQTGENTFGCIIDGKTFIPKDKTGNYSPGGGTPKGLKISSGEGIESFNYYDITARNFNNIYIYINQDRPEMRKYNFKLSPGTESSIQTPDFPHMYCILNGKKYISYENSGYIDFTKINFLEEVCAGKFNIKLKNKKDENDIIEISDGRFDIKCTKPI